MAGLFSMGYIRWNAMTMAARAHREHSGIGGIFPPTLPYPIYGKSGSTPFFKVYEDGSGRELGVDLNAVQGSGEAGYIRQKDVKDHVKNSSRELARTEYQSLPDFTKWGEIEIRSLSGIRWTMA